MSAAVAGTTFRPPRSYTTLWDVTTMAFVRHAEALDAVGLREEAMSQENVSGSARVSWASRNREAVAMRC
jgi:hypothetical protein